MKLVYVLGGLVLTAVVYDQLARRGYVPKLFVKKPADKKPPIISGVQQSGSGSLQSGQGMVKNASGADTSRHRNNPFVSGRK